MSMLRVAVLRGGRSSEHEVSLASAAAMARPAGGLAPGAAWKRDGISWTPQTSLYALTAAVNGEMTSLESECPIDGPNGIPNDTSGTR